MSQTFKAGSRNDQKAKAKLQKQFQNPKASKSRHLVAAATDESASPLLHSAVNLKNLKSLSEFAKNAPWNSQTRIFKCRSPWILELRAKHLEQGSRANIQQFSGANLKDSVKRMSVTTGMTRWPLLWQQPCPKSHGVKVGQHPHCCMQGIAAPKGTPQTGHFMSFQTRSCQFDPGLQDLRVAVSQGCKGTGSGQGASCSS